MTGSVIVPQLLSANNSAIYVLVPNPNPSATERAQAPLFPGDPVVLDLGWTPERNFEDGTFHLQVYETDFDGKQIYEFRSKDKKVVVTEIERLCRDISDGKSLE